METDELEVALQGFYQQRNVKTSAAQLVGRQVAKKIFSEQGSSSQRVDFRPSLMNTISTLR
jgi:hypothetical protein